MQRRAEFHCCQSSFLNAASARCHLIIIINNRVPLEPRQQMTTTLTPASGWMSSWSDALRKCDRIGNEGCMHNLGAFPIAIVGVARARGFHQLKHLAAAAAVAPMRGRAANKNGRAANGMDSESGPILYCRPAHHFAGTSARRRLRRRSGLIAPNQCN